MRHSILVVMFVGYGVLGCNEDPNAGKEGYSCRGGITGSLCNDELRCVDDICTPCGDIGSMCCNNVGGDFCNTAGLTCDESESALGSCTGDCGFIGMSCCPDQNCPGSGECNPDSGYCEAEGDSTCFNGDTTYVIHVVTASCGSYPVTLKTNTIDEAEACRMDYFFGGNKVSELFGVPTYSGFCANGEGGLYFYYVDEAQLAACQQQQCPDCVWTPTDVNGNCPLGF